jgi:hypothetical protein
MASLSARQLDGNRFVTAHSPPERIAPYLTWGLLDRALPPPAEERVVDVCFVGSLRTHPTRRSFFEALEREAARGEHRFALRACERGQPDRLDRASYRGLLASARIVVDLWGNGAHTYRLYEGLSAGALVLSQAPRWLPSEWAPTRGLHFDVFHSPAQMIEKLRYHLAAPAAREEVARAGCGWVRETFCPETIGRWLSTTLEVTHA